MKQHYNVESDKERCYIWIGCPLNFSGSVLELAFTTRTQWTRPLKVTREGESPDSEEPAFTTNRATQRRERGRIHR
jgi:hypothetical protein